MGDAVCTGLGFWKAASTPSPWSVLTVGSPRGGLAVHLYKSHEKAKGNQPKSPESCTCGPGDHKHTTFCIVLCWGLCVSLACPQSSYQGPPRKRDRNEEVPPLPIALKSLIYSSPPAMAFTSLREHRERFLECLNLNFTEAALW